MRPKMLRSAVPLLALAAGLAVAAPPQTQKATGKEGKKMKFEITSSAFKRGEPIPMKYSCEGADISPPLTFANVPPSAKSLALIMDDPDAPSGTWVHWVLYGLAPTLKEIPEGTAAKGTAPVPGHLGKNSWGRAEWGGPCPPGGKHRYVFTLYALDAELSLPRGATKPDLLRAMEGHIISQADLTGTYQRKP